MADAVIPANKIVPIFAAINAEATIWTPAAGKRFRILGYSVSSSGAAGGVTLRDGTGGNIILFIPAQAIGAPVTSPSMGNGYLSLTANNVVTATGTAAQVLTGFIYGTEE